MIKLGVNIDHVATLRQARRGVEPDPVWAASVAELAGADGITVHLREDRRHIQDRDLRILRETVRTRLNLEMSINKEVVDVAIEVKPDMATIVPERRQEITTEGGLDVITHMKDIKSVIKKLHENNIIVSLFIDPVIDQIKAAIDCGAEFIELHTGKYAEAKSEMEQKLELEKLYKASEYAVQNKIRVNAGHGINYWNVKPLVLIKGLEEFNIGHSIVSRAVFVGLYNAVKEMKQAILDAQLYYKTNI